MLPSRSAISPCGPESAVGSGYSRIRPLFGSSLPSLFAFCSVNQSDPSGATAGSCGRASGVGRSNSRMETGAAAASSVAAMTVATMVGAFRRGRSGTAKQQDATCTRRRKMRRRDAVAAIAGLVLAPWPVSAKKPEEEDVTPGEDLMREHGVLNRVLLVYEECARRLDGHEDPRAD